MQHHKHDNEYSSFKYMIHMQKSLPLFNPLETIVVRRSSAIYQKVKFIMHLSQNGFQLSVLQI